MASETSFASVIKNRGFINLWANQILVQLAYNSLNFALVIWVFKLTDSNTAVSALLFAIYLPAVILGLFAGVIVDSIDRRKIIILVDLLLAILFFSLIFTKNYYPAILITAFLINTLSQFYTPAESSAIPLLVKKEQLLSANSLFITTLFVAFLLGYGLAGPILAFWGINYVFIMGSVSLVIALALASRFPPIRTPVDATSRQLVEGIKGFRVMEVREVVNMEIKKTLGMVRGKLPVFASIMILSGVQAVIGILGVLIPSFLERIIKISATDASYIVISPLGAGMILGALTIGKLGQKIPRRQLVGSGIILAGALFLLVGIMPLVSPAIAHIPKEPFAFIHQPSLSWTLGIGSFLLGAALVSVMIPSQTVLQENSPKEDRGKVFSVLAVAMAGLSLIPVLFAGILADIFGTMPIIFAIGGLIGSIGLFVLKPDFFFEEHHLPHHLREFLGLGHWAKE
jgi:MFS family permease